MKSAIRFSKASGSTRRRVEEIARQGKRAAKRTLSARHRRTMAERLECNE